MEDRENIQHGMRTWADILCHGLFVKITRLWSRYAWKNLKLFWNKPLKNRTYWFIFGDSTLCRTYGWETGKLFHNLRSFLVWIFEQNMRWGSQNYLSIFRRRNQFKGMAPRWDTAVKICPIYGSDGTLQ